MKRTDALSGKTIFHCKYVKDGIVYEQFYRAGDSANDVREGLELFEWSNSPDDGKWIISDTIESEDEEGENNE